MEQDLETRHPVRSEVEAMSAVVFYTVFSSGLCIICFRFSHFEENTGCIWRIGCRRRYLG